MDNDPYSEVTPTKFIRVQCEWSLGEEDFLFENLDDARVWCKTQLVNSGITEKLSDLEDEGLITYRFAEVWHG